MKDKLLFILLVLTVGTALYSYDVYVTDKGGIGPIGRTIRFMGLDDEKNRSKLAQKGLSLTFDFRIREIFTHHNDVLDYVNSQRDEIFTERKEILYKLVELNKGLLEKSDEFMKVIYDQRKPYMENDQFISRLEKDLMETQQLNNPDLRKSRYQILEDQLMDVINQRVQFNSDETTRLKNIVYSIERIILQGEDFLITDCNDYDECSQKRSEEINNQLSRIFEPVLKDSGRNLEKLGELIGLWDSEYYLQLDNVESDKKSDNQSCQKIIGAFQNITNQLISITENDLKDIIYVYKALGIDYGGKIKKLEDDQKRSRMNMGFIHDQLIAVTELLKETTEMDFEDLVGAVEEFNMEYETLVKDMLLNDDQIRQLYKHRLFENRQFIDKVCNLMNIDMDRLMNDNQYAESIEKTYVQMRHRMKEAQ